MSGCEAVEITLCEQVVDVGCVTQVIEVCGTPGPRGRDGASSSTFFHSQATAADIWTINHNLGRYVNTTPYSVGGMEMLAEIIQASTNQVLIYFDAPQSGFAIAS